MTLNDIPNIGFTIHPDGSIDRLNLTGPEIPLERRKMRFTPPGGGEFNPMASLFAGIPVFGPAQILPE